MRTYTNPEANGYLTEAKACGKIVKELDRLIDKYKNAVNREEAARNAEFEEVMGYRSEYEIQEAYGWEFITEAQYDRYLELFRKGKAALEDHEKTVNEITLSILEKMRGDLRTDQAQWEFEALTPEQQAAERKRAEESQKAWKKKIAELKKKRGEIESDVSA